MKTIRWLLGRITLFLDRSFKVRQQMPRTVEQQRKVDSETTKLVLYQLEACPFCVRVRRKINQLGLTIKTRNIDKVEFHQELIQGGKMDQVPCLQIESEPGKYNWMYESTDINQYLEQRFGGT